MEQLEALGEAFPALALALREAVNLIGVSIIYAAEHKVIDWLQRVFGLPALVALAAQVLLGIVLLLLLFLSIDHAWWAISDFQHDRSVSLAFRPQVEARGVVAKGNVASDRLFCRAGVRVQIQRRNSGVWKGVDSTYSNADGEYRIGLRDKPGLYRAVIGETTADAQNTCLAVPSGAASIAPRGTRKPDLVTGR